MLLKIAVQHILCSVLCTVDLSTLQLEQTSMCRALSKEWLEPFDVARAGEGGGGCIPHTWLEVTPWSVLIDLSLAAFTRGFQLASGCILFNPDSNPPLEVG